MEGIAKQFDSYGKPIGFIVDDIQKGDRVRYEDSISGWDGKHGMTVKRELFGVWDGEKVQFDDKDKTIVFTKHWLKKI